MDEQRTLKLVEAAAELDELSEALGERPASPAVAAGRHGGRARWWIGLAAAAAIGVFAVVEVWPAPLAIRDLSVYWPAVRGVGDNFHIDLTLSRPGFVRVLLIDARGERWLMPIDGEADEHIKRVERTVSFRAGRYPHPEDPRGPAPAVAVIVLAGTTGARTATELLAAIPDPIVANASDEATREQVLRLLVSNLEVRFGGAVGYAAVPPP